MIDFFPKTIEHHIADGDKRCLVCSAWFRPMGMCATRCPKCMGEFYKNAKKMGDINPIANPAWPGMMSAVERQFTPNA